MPVAATQKHADADTVADMAQLVYRQCQLLSEHIDAMTLRLTQIEQRITAIEHDVDDLKWLKVRSKSESPR